MEKLTENDSENLRQIIDSKVGADFLRREIRRLNAGKLKGRRSRFGLTIRAALISVLKLIYNNYQEYLAFLHYVELSENSEVYFDRIYTNVELISGTHSSSNGPIKIFGPSSLYRYKVTIGKYARLGRDMEIILGKRHTPQLISNDTDAISRSDHARHLYYNYYQEEYGDVCIGNDVWVGNDVTIIGGVTIGDGAVVGAKSLVNKDIPPYSIVGGVPAKLIRKRFSDDQIQKIKGIEFWNLDQDVIEQNLELLYDVNLFIQEFSRLKPK